MYTIDNFAMLSPMKYYNNETPSQKRSDMLNDKNNEYIATEKHDGDWGMFIHYKKGKNLVRSRSISKVTGVYGDYTEKVPHLVAEMDTWPDNTVVLAELCFEEYGTNANTVGTILRCLPAKAVERQKETPLYAYVFDVLMVMGEDLTSYPYEDRICNRAMGLCRNLDADDAYYFRRTCIFYDGIDFEEAADEIIAAGGEGVVIQRKDNPYMPGTRTAWKTLKLKQSLPEMELKVVATLEPNRLYEGDMPDSWPYLEVYGQEIDTNGEWKVVHYMWEMIEDDRPVIDGVYITDVIPVTKPYYYGWKNGIRVEYNGITTDVTSGLTDEDREWLASDDAAKMIANGELYAVIKCMSENDKGRLRHPYVVRLRNDI